MGRAYQSLRSHARPGSRYIQKDGYPQGYADWKDFVIDVMEAMELQDAGQFPDSWYDDEDDQ